MSELKREKLTVIQEKAVLAGVILPGSTADLRDPLGELGSLAKTAGAKVVGQVLQKRQAVDASTYIGSGKVKEIAAVCGQEEADVVIFDNDLSPAQIGAIERTVNKELGMKIGEGVKVLDRSELILDIFATRAQTHEAKLQVELAQLEYTYPRLTKMWGHLERIASGTGGSIGARGPGEMQLEIDRRLVRKRVADLKQEISKIQERKTREVASRNRQHFTVCVVGYTNAGKSTLFNTLTAAGTYADDKLFATLDTKTRAWKLGHGMTVMLSDTVGFVRDLPHKLVASFKATLEEAVHADLLLHVLDVGHPHAEQQYKSVHEVLKEIGANNQPEILLLNKIDTEDGGHKFPEWRAVYPEAIPVSAKTGAGTAELHEAIYKHFRGQQYQVEMEVDLTNGKLLAFLEAKCRIEDRQFTEEKVRLTAVIGKNMLRELRANEQIRVLEAKSAK